MQKEKQVKSYTRRTKSGKTVVVHAYKAKYDAAEEMKKALAKKSGAGKELIKKQQAATDAPLGFSAEEFKQWYHWDLVDDPKNKAALKVEKALKKSMGTKVYKKFFDEVTDGYSARGHNKALKSLESSLSTPKKETSTKGQKGEPSKKTGDTSKPTSAKEMKVQKIGKVTFGKGSNLRLETWDDDPMMKGAATVYYKGGNIDEAGYKKIEAEMAKRGYKSSDFPFHEGDGTGFFSFQKKDVPVKSFRPPKSGKASPAIHVDDRVVRQYAKDEDISLKTAREEFRGMSKRDQLSIKSNQEKYAKRVQKRAEASAPKSVKSIESKLAEMTHLAGNDAKQAVKLLKEAGYRRKKVTYTANDGNREDWALISPDGHRVYMTRGGNTMLMKFPGITSAKDIKKSEKPLTYGQAFKRAKDNFKKSKAKQDNLHPVVDSLVDTFGVRDKMRSNTEKAAYEKKLGYTRGGKYHGHQILERNGKAYKWDFFGVKLSPLNKRETTEYFERRNKRATSK